MELKEFIKQSIIQISEGVLEGHKHVTSTVVGEGVADEYHRINFDVAVVSDEQDKKDLGGKISIASVFSAGTSSEKIQKNTNHSRIQFNIQVHITTTNKRGPSFA